MKKIILILSLFILSIQIQLFAQDIESIKAELNKSTGENKFLKDFTFNLEPNGIAKYSLLLQKNTKYEFAFYLTEPNQILFNINDKNDLILEGGDIFAQPGISKLDFTCPKTAVYHLIIQNLSNKDLESAILLSFKEIVEAPETEDNWVTIEAPVAIEKSTKTTEFEKNDLFLIVEQMPRFKGSDSKENSDEAFKKFILENTTYPQEAKDKKITGRVYVSFVVSSDGYIKNAKVSRSVHPSLDQEALRIIYASPKWEPGIKDGKPVNVSYTIPIDFKLE